MSIENEYQDWFPEDESDFDMQYQEAFSEDDCESDESHPEGCHLIGTEHCAFWCPFSIGKKGKG